MGDQRWYECLRDGHRFQVDDYDPKQVAERTCPKCGSNSVRPEPASRAAAGDSASARS